MPVVTFILWKWVEDVLSWFKDALLWVPLRIWEYSLDGLAAVIEAIPVPDFMVGLSSWIAGIDPAVAYFGAPLQIETGITFVLTAWVIRFALRRIPVIG